MSIHTCPNCGMKIDCDKRNIGTGRKTPLTRYGANHEAVHRILQDQPGWWTMRQLQANLSFKNIEHMGKRSQWNYVAVQSVLSDLA